MYELRVVALSEDARHVVLAPVLPGRRERYRVAVDDRLRAALRGELGRLERKIRPDSALTPREIQARVRAGETAETIAAAAGVAVEWVLRFETPVLAERAQVASQARHASLSVSGGEWTGVPLEEIVAARLEADGNRPEVADWDAWRRDDGRWVLALRVGSFAAHWLWDPALQRLVVHDDAARSLLQPDGVATGPAMRLAEPRRLTLAPLPLDSEPEGEPETGPRHLDALEPELGVELRSESDPDAEAVSGHHTGQRSWPEHTAEATGRPPAATGSGAAGGGEHGASSSGTESSADPGTATDSGSLTAPEEPADDSAGDPSRAARRGSRRKSVPSWEDILLGTGAGPGTGAGSGSG